MVGSLPASVGTRAWPGLRCASVPRRRNNLHSPRRSSLPPARAIALFSPSQADNTEAGFAVPRRGPLPMGLDLEPGRSISAFGRKRARRSDRRNNLGPSIPSAVLNHTVPGMVTSPLTIEEWGRNRAGMWPRYHKAREKWLDGFWPGTPWQPKGPTLNGPNARGCSHHLRGYTRPRDPFGQRRSLLGSSRETLRLSLTPDGGFASIGGSGVGHSLHAQRLFDIVIWRKGNADGGVLASSAPKGRATRLWQSCVFISQ